MTDSPGIDTDIREHGRLKDGSQIHSDTRLYMQHRVWTGCPDPQALIPELEATGWDLALYQDVNDPHGVGLLSMHTDPGFLAKELLPWLRKSGFATLVPQADMTLFGRSYSIGYEEDLENVLVNRPRKRALDPTLPWVVWYPLRRVGGFNTLERREKMKILGEHGTIGRAYGEADLATDIRLACFGMDKNDNDFIVALLGDDLCPLSKVVETMRGTIQTSQFMEKMGPFFVGHVLYQSKQ